VTRTNDSIAGWYGLLCLLLLVWQPLRVGLTASSSLDAVVFGSAVVILTLCVRLIVAGLGFAAGLALASRRPGGVTLAKASLILSGVTDLFVLLTPYVPDNRAPGEAPVLLAATLTYHLGWLLYLYRSKKVRAVQSGIESKPAFDLTN
jgi:hypothetical protein